MSIMWFKQAARGRGSGGSDRTFKITFTDRPKGVRLNAALTKHLVAAETQYVQIGVSDSSLVVRPIAEKRDSFKLIINKNSGQICSTAIGEWARERGLLKRRAIGIWDQEMSMYEFKLAEMLEDRQAAGGRTTTVASE